MLKLGLSEESECSCTAPFLNEYDQRIAWSWARLFSSFSSHTRRWNGCDTEKSHRQYRSRILTQNSQNRQLCISHCHARRPNRMTEIFHVLFYCCGNTGMESQHRKLTLENKVLPPLLRWLEPEPVFWRARASVCVCVYEEYWWTNPDSKLVFNRCNALFFLRRQHAVTKNKHNCRSSWAYIIYT